jgi:hypothetical protein
MATVSATGVVTGISAGSLTITAETVDGGFTDTCAVTVTGGAAGDSPDNPIIITTAAQLDAVRDGLNKYYKLGGNIDLTSYLASGGAGYSKWGTAGWMPIGTAAAHFTGGFDGAEFRITSLRIDRSNMNYIGLFGFTNGATIKNLGVEAASASIRGYLYVGVLVGNQQDGSITNCYATGNVIGDSYVGGLVGYQYSYNNSTISSCYATGNVSGSTSIGGLVGHQFLSSGAISITNCYATGNVSGTDWYVGGLVGEQYALTSHCDITNSYATGNVNGTNYIGGLVGGQTGGSITGSYAIGSVRSNSYSGNALSSYATGNNSLVAISIGGLVGGQQIRPSTITNSYRYQYAILNGFALTENTPNEIHGGIVTETQLMTQATYINNRWVFGVGRWFWDNRGFPKLNMGMENFPFRFSDTAGNSPDNPIIIKTAAELDAIRIGLKKYYKLGGNIDLTSYLARNGAGYTKWGAAGWLPIGTSVAPFAGGLDGAGYKISGLWIDRTNSSYVGLFGYTNVATITNLGVEIASAGVKGLSYVGGLAGYIYANNSGNSIVTNCYVTGNIIGVTYYVGGLAGSQNISNGSIFIGNCYTTGNVSGSVYVGGLVGEQYSYSGKNVVTITNCYTTGNVSGANYVGGLAGRQYSYFGSSYINHSYATGNISGSNSIGGLVGFQYANSGESAIINCYSSGNVTSANTSVGGLVGIQSYSSGGAVIITNSYRYQLARINNIVRTENTPNGVHGGTVTATQLKTQLTYVDNKWHFGVGSWHWDVKDFPKLNIGEEKIPFQF